MYTNYTAPGVFSLAGNGMGPAAAENSTYSVIGAANPTKPGDFPALFATGLGAVTPSLVDGVLSTPPWNLANIYNSSSLNVYFDGLASPDISFAGVAPGYAAGLYQINAQVPAGVSNGDDYLDILTPDAEAEQVTLHIAGASGAVRKLSGLGRRARSSPAVARPAVRVSR